MMNARVESFTTSAASPPDPAGPPLASLEIIDREAVRQIDPLQPAVFILYGAPTEPKELAIDGKVIARITGCDRGQKLNFDVVPELLALLCADLGTEDTGETSADFEAEGIAAVQAVLENPPPAAPPAAPPSLRGWRGELDSRQRQAEAVGRCYGLAPEAIERITGRRYVPRKHLLPTCGAIAGLEEKRKAEAEAAAREAEAVEAVRVEIARPKTAGELGLEVIEVDVSARAFGALLGPPFKNAWPLGVRDGLTFWGFRRIDGYELPLVRSEGIRVFDRSEVVNHLGAPMPEASYFDCAFAITLRAQRGTGYDFGPISRDRFGERGMPRAEELVRKYAGALQNPQGPLGWRSHWLLQFLVRGLLVRPDIAAAMCIRSRDAYNRGAEPDLMGDALGATAALHALRGDISAGCAFGPASPSTSHETKSKKDRGR
jgi:hypothetical protein